jgi:hypothetical protein
MRKVDHFLYRSYQRSDSCHVATLEDITLLIAHLVDLYRSEDERV